MESNKTPKNLLQDEEEFEEGGPVEGEHMLTGMRNRISDWWNQEKEEETQHFPELDFEENVESESTPGFATQENLKKTLPLLEETRDFLGNFIQEQKKKEETESGKTLSLDPQESKREGKKEKKPSYLEKLLERLNHLIEDGEKLAEVKGEAINQKSYLKDLGKFLQQSSQIKEEIDYFFYSMNTQLESQKRFEKDPQNEINLASIKQHKINVDFYTSWANKKRGKTQQNEVLEYATEQFNQIYAAAQKTKDIDDLVKLKKMVDKISRFCNNEILYQNLLNKKYGKFWKKKPYRKFKNTAEARDKLKEVIDHIGDKLSDSSILKGTVDPKPYKLTESTEHPLLKGIKKENVKYIHKKDNYNSMLKAVDYATQQIENYFLIPSKTTQEHEEWQKNITACRSMLERLEQYLIYLDTLSYDDQQKRRNDVENKILQLKSALFHYGYPLNDPTQAQIATRSYSKVITAEEYKNYENATVTVPDSTATSGTKDVSLSTIHSQEAFNVVTNKMYVPMGVGHGTIKTTNDFDGKNTVRVNHTIVNTYDQTNKKNVQADFISIQRIVEEKGEERFASEFKYSRQQLEDLSKEERFILAIKEADNFIMALKDRSKKVIIAGDYPDDFVKAMVDYLIIKKQACEDLTKTDYQPPGSFWSLRSTKNMLATHSREIFGEASKLGMHEKDVKKMEKKVKVTQDDLEINPPPKEPVVQYIQEEESKPKLNF